MDVLTEATGGSPASPVDGWSEPQPSGVAAAPGGPPRRATDGVQSVERALEILRVLAFSSAVSGVRFSDLMVQTGLTKGTLHRILKTLTEKGFVERDRATRLYFLGFEFLSLGARAGNRSDLQVLSRPSLTRLANLTKDTVYLLVRSGAEAVCLEREEGTYPIKTLTQSVGMRRPLGIGSGALAILSAMPDDEVNDMLRRNRSRLGEYPSYTPTAIKALVAETRQQGYAANVGGILRGMNGVGVPIIGGRGEVMAALSVAAISERMGPERRAQIAVWLREEAQRITRLLGSKDDDIAGRRLA